MFRQILPLLIFSTSISFAATPPKPDLTPLNQALAKQTTYQSVIVKIRQTKKIPALSEPIKTTGKVWLKPGKSFRWQLGDPKASTVIFDGKQVYLLNESQKSAACYPPTDRRIKPLLLMLGIGEGASVKKMATIFRVTGVTTHGDHYIAAFVPKSVKLKRVLKSMVLQINTKTSFMERIEWVQKDGTIVTTEFYPPQINAPLPKEIFTFDASVYHLK